MRERGKAAHTVDVLFPLAFILLFGVCALAVVLSGARIYQKTAAGLKKNYTVRTAAAYVQEKVRECGGGQIAVTAFGDGSALAIDSEIGEQEFTTYVYLSEGELKELFVKKGGEARASSGESLVEADTFSIEEAADGLFYVELGKDGETERFYLRTRADSR